jgi:hypothetical protein
MKLLPECLNTNFSVLSPIKLQPLKIKLLVGKLRTQNRIIGRKKNVSMQKNSYNLYLAYKFILPISLDNYY